MWQILNVKMANFNMWNEGREMANFNMWNEGRGGGYNWGDGEQTLPSLHSNIS